MSTLSINRGILGQFLDLCLIFLSISFFFLILLKSSLFPAYHQTFSEKWRSRTHSPLDCREIWAPGLKLISKNSHCWELRKKCLIWEKYPLHRNLFFPAKTQSELSKEKLEESQEIARDAAIIVEIHTWAHLEVRNEFIAIGVRMNMCRDP